KIIGERYKNATVNYLTKSKFRSLVEFHPTVSNIINLEEHSSLTQLRNSIKKSEYDLIIDLHNSMRSKLITFGLKNVKRYKKHKIQRYFLTKFKIRIGEFLHVTQKYLEAINVKEKINSFKIFLPPDEKIRDNLRDKFQQLKKSKSILGISVGASKPSKMFPIHKLIDIINSVGSNFDEIVFLGNGELENELTKTIADRINFKSINLCSQLTISELMLFVNELTVFIGNDSGIAHISAGTGVNTIAFFGQTVPEYGFTPIGNVEIIEPEEELSCRPCGHLGHDKCPKKHHYCMETMSSEKIVNKIKKFNL
ncbi:MAG: glycosyltransferase family 9 protein, partial [Candidatus Marinimicrobia bacterium]|nr:glycosyltransferase family 9 protein [Candidatus Neomarinimicrobiota bacterium]